MKIGMERDMVPIQRLGERSLPTGAGKPAEKSGPDIDSNPKLLPSVLFEEHA